MKTIIFSCLLILISFLISSCAASRIAQAPTEKTYNIKLVKGIHTDTVTKTSTAVIFAITPKQMIDFAPVLSMKVRYSVNDSTYEDPVDLQKQKEQKIRFGIYGKNIAEKSPSLYQHVKDSVSFEDHERIMFLVIYFKDISKSEIKNMAITYGLWEKRNTNQRIEETYHVDFE